LPTLQQAKNNERDNKPNFINIEEKSGNSTFMVNVNVYSRFYALIMDKISDLFKAQKLDFLEALEALKKEVRTQGEEFKSDIEEKIDSMYGEIISSFTDVRRENISAEQDDQYLLEIKNELIDQWNMLDGGTQEMLPIARYLHEGFSQKAGIGAYPLAVWQYCRCLENELLVKIYQVRNLKGNTFGGIVEDLSILSKGKRDSRNQQSEYIRLRKSLEGHFDIDKLLSESFLVDLRNIVKYRNKAAHMEPLGSEDADKCRKKVMAGLRDFLNFAVAHLH